MSNPIVAQSSSPCAPAFRSTSMFEMSINVRLCGSIPRKDMMDKTVPPHPRRSAPCCGPPISQVNRRSVSPFISARTNGLTSTVTKIAATKSNHRTISCFEPQQPLSYPPSSSSALMKTLTAEELNHACKCVHSPACAGLEPPSWAVAAKCESRLEPVCDAIARHSAVDLTTRSCFRVGRSPNSDIQLFYATSSRRHAMLFHHENGSCYIVDCGSAHGTFVNGVRISSPLSSGEGKVIPHKVKRGALIQFGGAGAPCFLLKSFHFYLADIDHVSSSLSQSEPDMGELVRRNTRLNALGRTAASFVWGNLFSTFDSAQSVTRKRSFDSSDSRDTMESLIGSQEIINQKKMRCSSPPLSTEELPMRLVSPDVPSTFISLDSSVLKRVTFSLEPPTLFQPAYVGVDPRQDDLCMQRNLSIGDI